MVHVPHVKKQTCLVMFMNIDQDLWIQTCQYRQNDFTNARMTMVFKLAIAS